MKASTVILQNPRALAVPGFKGGPAPYASQTLAYILLGANSRIVPPSPQNDNQRETAA